MRNARWCTAGRCQRAHQQLCLGCPAEQGHRLAAMTDRRFIPPAAPVPKLTLPRGAGWLHEPKLDGWRLQAHKAGSRITLMRRNGFECTRRFPAIAAALQTYRRRRPSSTASSWRSERTVCPISALHRGDLRLCFRSPAPWRHRLSARPADEPKGSCRGPTGASPASHDRGVRGRRSPPVRGRVDGLGGERRPRAAILALPTAWRRDPVNIDRQRIAAVRPLAPMQRSERQ